MWRRNVWMLNKTMFYLIATVRTVSWFFACFNTGLMIFVGDVALVFKGFCIVHQIPASWSAFSGLLVKVLWASDVVASLCRSVKRLQHVLRWLCYKRLIKLELKLTCNQELLRINARLRFRFCALALARVASMSSVTGNPLSIIVYWLSSLLSLKRVCVNSLFSPFLGVSLTGRVGFGGVYVSHPPTSQHYLLGPNCLSLPLRPGPLRLVRFSFF